MPLISEKVGTGVVKNFQIDISKKPALKGLKHEDKLKIFRSGLFRFKSAHKLL